MKRFFALSLAVIILLSIFGCKGTKSEDKNASITNNTEIIAEKIEETGSDELKRAFDYGFVPKELWITLDDTITWKQFYEMASNVAEAYGTGQEKWEDTAEEATTLDTTMTRDDGVVASTMLAVCMGLMQFNRQESLQEDEWLGKVKQKGNYPLKDYTKEYTFFTSNGLQSDLIGPAFFEAGYYNMRRMSWISNRIMFELDQEKGFHLEDDLTTQDAILALTRLYESVARIVEPTEVQKEPVHYIPIEEVGSYNKTIITDDIVQYANSVLPTVTAENLPEWRALHYEEKACISSALQRNYYKQEIQYAAQAGFNSIHLLTDFSYFSAPDNIAMVNEAELEQLDEVISWALAYGLHVVISCCGIPGYADSFGTNIEYYDTGRCINSPDSPLFNDSQAQEWTTRYWQMIAKRYAALGPNALSYELFFEPGATEESYVTYCSGLADAIWAVSPGSVLYVMSAVWFDNSNELFEKGCCISWHDYVFPLFDPVRIKREFGIDYQLSSPMPLVPGYLFEQTFTILQDGGYQAGTLRLMLSSGDVAGYADGVEMQKSTEKDGVKDWIELSIPQGAKKLEIRSISYARMLAVQIVQEGKEPISLATTDYFGAWTYYNPDVIIQIDENGIATNVPNSATLKEFFYQNEIKPILDICEQYHISAFWTEATAETVNRNNEAGVTPQETFTYAAMVFDILEEHHIAWSYNCAQDLFWDPQTMPWSIQYRDIGYDVELEEGGFYRNKEVESFLQKYLH